MQTQAQLLRQNQDDEQSTKVHSRFLKQGIKSYLNALRDRTWLLAPACIGTDKQPPATESELLIRLAALEFFMTLYAEGQLKLEASSQPASSSADTALVQRVGDLEAKIGQLLDCLPV